MASSAAGPPNVCDSFDMGLSHHSQEDCNTDPQYGSVVQALIHPANLPASIGFLHLLLQYMLARAVPGMCEYTAMPHMNHHQDMHAALESFWSASTLFNYLSEVLACTCSVLTC